MKITKVSPCPHCQSLKTGLVLPDIGIPSMRQIKRKQKRGCYLKYSSPFDWKAGGLNPNSFCQDCDYEWIEEHVVVDLLPEEYNAYLEDRELLGLDIRYHEKKKMFVKIRNIYHVLMGK